MTPCLYLIANRVLLVLREPLGTNSPPHLPAQWVIRDRLHTTSNNLFPAPEMETVLCLNIWKDFMWFDKQNSQHWRAGLKFKMSGEGGEEKIYLVTASVCQRGTAANTLGSFGAWCSHRPPERGGLTQPVSCQIEQCSNGARLHGGHLHRRWLCYLSLQQMVCLMHTAWKVMVRLCGCKLCLKPNLGHTHRCSHKTDTDSRAHTCRDTLHGEEERTPLKLIMQ